MTTIEAPIPVVETILEEDDRDEEKPCHLYLNDANRTMCGIPRDEDWHWRAHTPRNVFWKKGSMSCPECKAPICMDCLLTAS